MCCLWKNIAEYWIIFRIGHKKNDEFFYKVWFIKLILKIANRSELCRILKKNYVLKAYGTYTVYGNQLMNKVDK